jgi:four helix bundle protein
MSIQYLVYGMQYLKMEKTTIKNFTDLIAWQKARDFAVMIYKQTENFPKTEIFGLSSQLRRAAVSVSSNIAEGFPRNTSKDKKYFYAVAKGSLTEIESQLLIANKLDFLKDERLHELLGVKVETSKLLSGLIKSSLSHTVY